MKIPARDLTLDAAFIEPADGRTAVVHWIEEVGIEEVGIYRLLDGTNAPHDALVVWFNTQLKGGAPGELTTSLVVLLPDELVTLP